MTRRRFLIPCLLLLCFAGAFAASAAEVPPSRVGRVGSAEGTVAVRPAGGEWTDSGLNDPVASGMSVRTAGPARATLGIGAEIVALSGGTELEVARLDDNTRQIALRQGRIGVHLAYLDPDENVEIDLPRGGIWLLMPGDYDIAAGDDQTPARVAVYEGRARFVGGGADRTVTIGSAVVLRGKSAIDVTLDGAVGDDFAARWRPAPADPLDPADPVALHYVSPDMTGYEALDGNGSWESASGFGEVWYPKTLPDDWAPYRYGHWRWVAPWGWSWIDDAAWGFATSHYGRWARVPQVSPEASPLASPQAERWAWVPGARVAHPVYAPGLVDFLGTAGVGLSYPGAVGPAVAWFPLAPGEAYWPSYTSDLDLIRRINTGAVAEVSRIEPGINGEPPADIVTADYRNRRFASVVPRAVFVGGRAVAASLVQLPEQRLENAPLLPGSPQIAPVPPRLAASARPYLAGAVRTLAGILTPRVAMAAARTTIVLRGARAAGSAEHAGPAAHWAAASTQLVRPRVIGAVALAGRIRARLAAVARR